MERRSSIERERERYILRVDKPKRESTPISTPSDLKACPSDRSLSFPLATHDNVSARSDTVRLLLLSGSHSLEI